MGPESLLLFKYSFLTLFIFISLVAKCSAGDGSYANATQSESSVISGGGCVWLPVSHFSFQIANVCLFLSYLAFNSLNGLIYLRTMLGIGCIFFAVWGWVILCALDTVVWNIFFMVLNFGHAILLMTNYRHVKFDEEVEMVYTSIFKPLKLPRSQFKKVVGCLQSVRPSFSRGDHFAIEKQTKVESLSLLLSGGMMVFDGDKMLHTVTPMQFLDSPEWFGIGLTTEPTDDFKFQVSIKASEESRLLVWNREKLKKVMAKEPYIQAVFDQVLGKDVVNKLVAIKVK